MSYEVKITDGYGTVAMKEGAYSVTVTEANGYDLTTFSPTSVTITGDTTTKEFTIDATGTLIFTVSEEAGGTGKLITAGQIIMTDATGTITYGSPVNIQSNGIATFPNVPFSASSPVTLYFKQLSSDGAHAPYDGVIAVSMDDSTKTASIINLPYKTQTIHLVSANYGIEIPDATIQFTETV